MDSGCGAAVEVVVAESVVGVPFWQLAKQSVAARTRIAADTARRARVNCQPPDPAVGSDWWQRSQKTGASSWHRLQALGSRAAMVAWSAYQYCG